MWTIPKIKDSANSSNRQYQHIYDILATNNHHPLSPYDANSMAANNTAVTDNRARADAQCSTPIDRLPSSPAFTSEQQPPQLPPPTMKLELKHFLKQYLQTQI